MKEEDIRKREVFNRYLELVKKDATDFFDKNSFKNTDCPACGSVDFNFEFEKNGFNYVTCKKCATLFVNPRPNLDMMRKFYSESPSTAFWVNKFFKPVAEVRREKMFKPRAEYLAGLMESSRDKVVAEIGAGFGIFLEEMRKLLPYNNYIAIEPSVEMADLCENKGFEVRRSMFEEVSGMDGKADVLISFELLEHLVDPSTFFKKAYSLLKPGGKIFFTTLNGLGFDILLLWERSKSVTPPHHLNFFNTSSVRLLLERAGFVVEEVSTPGSLDWDIVEGMILNEGLDVGKFWNSFADKGSAQAKVQLQDWITNNRLSSHMRVVARKQ